MENTSTLLVLAFNTTIQFKRKILDFSGTNITFTEKGIQHFVQKLMNSPT